MFGLFQADLPIGRRLWLLVLTLVSLGSLKAINITASVSDPVKFVTDTLLFFGYITLITSGLLLIPDGIRNIIREVTDKNLEKSSPYEAAVKWKLNRWWIHSLQDIAFIGATVIAAKDFGSKAMYDWGTLGIFSILLDEIIDWDDIYVKTKQILELSIAQDGKIRAKLVRSSNVEEFIVPSENWLLEIQSLKHSGWEVLESNLLGKQKSIILERNSSFNIITVFFDFLERKSNAFSDFLKRTLNRVLSSKTAQQSVHLTLGILRRIRAFFRL